MRNKIVHFGADEQHYEIREIVDVAKKIRKNYKYYNYLGKYLRSLLQNEKKFQIG